MENKKSKETALIPKLANEDYINNPLGYAMAGGNWSMVQRKIYVDILKKMQDRISGELKSGKQLSLIDHLFSDEDRQKESIKFTIKLNELGIRTKDYKHVKTACEELVNINCNFKYKNESGELIEEFTHLFHTARVHKRIVGGKEQLTGKMEVEMGSRVADHVFSLKRGYIQQLEDFIMECSNARTYPLYSYLCTLNTKQNQKEGDIEYMRLMEVLGIVTYKTKKETDKNGKEVERKETEWCSESYKTYSIFERDVLLKIQDEMNRLCVSNKVEFSFLFTPIRPKGKKIGTPTSFHFTLIDANHPTLFNEAEVIEDEETIKAREAEQKRIADADQKVLEEIRMAAEGDKAMRSKYGNSWEILAKKHGFDIK